MIDWKKQPLGKVPDALLAERLGISTSDVANARRRWKIPVHRAANAHAHASEIDWNEQPLGQVSDAKIAEQIGLSTHTFVTSVYAGRSLRSSSRDGTAPRGSTGTRSSLGK